MHRTAGAALLCGATMLLGVTSLAFAQVDGPEPSDGPMQGLMRHERLADRLLDEFDANHDGKITHAEFNNILGSHFAAATHGAKMMSADQFLAIHQEHFTKHTLEIFRRLDWNGDGRVTLEEYVAPQRAHFEMMDREGNGTVACNPVATAEFRPGSSSPRTHDFEGGYRSATRGGRGFADFGRARFCNDADLSRDGRVTRAEFNTVTAKEFATAAGGAAAMTLQQFMAAEAAHFRGANDKSLKRDDANADDKLTLAEFAAPAQKLFDRLDRNHDGTISADEMKPRFRGRDRADYHPKTGDHNRRP